MKQRPSKQAKGVALGASTDATNAAENLLLARALEMLNPPGLYVWVASETFLAMCTGCQREDRIRNRIEYAVRMLGEEGYAVRGLVEDLYRINRTESTITLASSEVNGYWIDRENRFPGYFHDEWGWERFVVSSPGVTNFVEVSRPAMNPEGNLALLGMNIRSEGAVSFSIRLYSIRKGWVNLCANIHLGHADLLW